MCNSSYLDGKQFPYTICNGHKIVYVDMQQDNFTRVIYVPANILSGFSGDTDDDKLVNYINSLHINKEAQDSGILIELSDALTTLHCNLIPEDNHLDIGSTNYQSWDIDNWKPANNIVGVWYDYDNEQLIIGSDTYDILQITHDGFLLQEPTTDNDGYKRVPYPVKKYIDNGDNIIINIIVRTKV